MFHEIFVPRKRGAIRYSCIVFCTVPVDNVKGFNFLTALKRLFGDQSQCSGRVRSNITDEGAMLESDIVIG